MSYLTNIGNAIMGKQKANVVIAPTQMYMDFLSEKVGVVQNETISAVYRCVNILATYISILPLQVINMLQPYTSHPLYYILKHQPNAWQNPQAFWSLVLVHFNFYGNAFIRIHRNDYTGTVKSFEIIHPQWIGGYNFINGELFFYIDHSKNPDASRTDVEPVNYSDLIHIKDITTDGILGISRMQAANDSAQILGKAGKTISTFYDNHAHSTLALEGKLEGIDQVFTDTVKESMAKWQTEQTGVYKAGKVIEVPWGRTLKPIPVNYVDVQLIETMRFTRDQVFTIFGVPDFFKEGNNVNIEQQLLQFKAFTIVPISSTMTAELEFKLLSRPEKINGLKIAHDFKAMLDADMITKANAAKTMITSGTMTPNEGAKWLGNQPIDGKFGDLHYVQQQNQPIEYYDKWPKSNMNPQTQPNNGTN